MLTEALLENAEQQLARAENTKSNMGDIDCSTFDDDKERARRYLLRARSLRPGDARVSRNWEHLRTSN